MAVHLLEQLWVDKGLNIVVSLSCMCLFTSLLKLRPLGCENCGTREQERQDCVSSLVVYVRDTGFHSHPINCCDVDISGDY